MDKYYWNGKLVTTSFIEEVRMPMRKYINVSVSHSNATGASLNGYIDFYISNGIKVGYVPLGLGYRYNINSENADRDNVTLMLITPDTEALKCKVVLNDVESVNLTMAVTERGD